MAAKMNQRPRSIAELANQLGVLIDDLYLPCRFCLRSLHLQDCLNFDFKKLQLLYKCNGIYACCSGCSRTLATREHDIFCRLELLGHELYDLLHIPLFLIFMRCRRCLKVLSQIEKLDMISTNQHFCSIRGWWRGICSVCRSQ